MQNPVSGSRIRWCLEPATWRENVVPSIFVYVADSDSMLSGSIADDMPDPRAALRFVPRLRGTIFQGHYLVGTAVVVDIRRDRVFDAEPLMDDRFLPRPRSLAGVAVPNDLLLEAFCSNDIDPSVPVDVK